MGFGKDVTKFDSEITELLHSLFSLGHKLNVAMTQCNLHLMTGNMKQPIQQKGSK